MEHGICQDLPCVLYGPLKKKQRLFPALTVFYIRHAVRGTDCKFKLIKPTSYVMHQQFNIQQLYALPTLYLCVLYLSENKQRVVPLTAQTDWFL